MGSGFQKGPCPSRVWSLEGREKIRASTSTLDLFQLADQKALRTPKERIEALEETPLPVAELFARLLEAAGRATGLSYRHVHVPVGPAALVSRRAVRGLPVVHLRPQNVVTRLGERRID